MLEFILSLASFLLVIGILVVFHELGHFVMARWFGIGVEEFAFGLPPRIIARKKGNTVYALNAIPVGGYVKLEGENGEEEVSNSQTSFQNKPPWQRFLVLFAGSAVHLVMAVLIFTALILSQGRHLSDHTIQIVDVEADSPAALADLATDDRIVAIDGERLGDTSEFLDRIQDKAGVTIDLSVIKAGQDKISHVSLIPRVDPPKGQGRTGAIITEGSFKAPVSLLEAGWYGVQFTYEVVEQSFIVVSSIFVNLFQKATLPADIAGPVGIAEISGQVAKTGGLIGLLSLIGLLAANLAVLNLFPFPGLDGGRIIFVVLEAFRGKKIPPEKEAWVHGLGLILLLVFIAAVTYRDLLRLFGVS